MAQPIGLVCCLMVIFAFILQAEAQRNPEIPTNADEACKGASTVLDRFPSFFRTEREQKILDRKYRGISRPSQTFPPTGCTFTCPLPEPTTRRPNGRPVFVPRNKLPPFLRSGITGKPQPRPGRATGLRKTDLHTSNILRDKRMSEDDWVYHACCKSREYSHRPATAFTLDDQPVNIVQLYDVGQFQYFIRGDCETDGTCSNCQCVQPTPFIYQAVVAGNPEYVEWIKLPGCCKCLNIAFQEE